MQRIRYRAVALRMDVEHAISEGESTRQVRIVADNVVTPPSPMIAGLLGRCPRCGKGRLFEGFLTVRPRCESCNLDFSFADSADGPAVFVSFLSGVIVAV